ncbi:MAG TPA: sulfite exporter TauE/SafE family protein [Nitrospirae bacterium]|nr:sulfite exporter TauE/SafE [bacterium BMS3Abin10]GBE38508.1 sulfite exporter TauE/SafE [bacterium BMS3Bbin08]HDH00596.1 sulfite exporter TauE/SafE family protein [Nitrospirota bacterium]HDK82086.1 sulfite exporter TauE/SafE family protein [Nitrospirota bacterium]
MHDVAAQAIDKLTVVSQIFGTSPWIMLGVILLGFMGGTLSGFIGSGGAFLMTPGMMNLGVPGVMAVAANITHKFGKAMMGSKKHGELGHVDRKLGIYLLITACIGIRAAVVVNGYFFEKLGSAGSGLYVSAFFVITLSIIGYSLLKDALRSQREPGAGPSDKLLNLSRKFQFKPLIHFKIADVEVSFVVLLFVGLAIGYMAGTIGVGGFIGVPAMIYVFGVPTVVAAGTELFLAMFMGAWGAFNYGMQGYVDLRLVLLLYAGSLVGIYFGAVGTHLVKELYIRMVTAVLILLCVVSRALAIPEYLQQLNLLKMGEGSASMFEIGSKIFLFGSGIIATFLVLYWTFKAKAKEKKA